MAVTVTKEGNQLKVVNGTKTRYDNVDDIGIDINQSADTVTLRNNKTSKQIVNELASDYSAPSGVDAEAVADAIAELM